MTGMPYLDLQPLREAVEDIAVVVEILETFRVDALTRLDLLEQASREREPTTVAREAHALKGMCLSIGAMALAQCCIDVESPAEAGDTTALLQLLPSLRACTSETMGELDRQLRELGQSAA